MEGSRESISSGLGGKGQKGVPFIGPQYPPVRYWVSITLYLSVQTEVYDSGSEQHQLLIAKEAILN